MCPTSATIPVRTFTAHLNHPATSMRAARHQAYIQLALGCSSPAAAAALPAFRRTLRSVWRLPCDNTVKQTLWSLSIDALPGAHFRPWRCPCCVAATPVTPAHAPRQHVFWACPIAVAVRQQLAQAIHPIPLHLSTLLLLHPPHTFHPPVWHLVCCAALAAMEHGRRALWSAHHHPSLPASPPPPAVPTCPSPSPPTASPSGHVAVAAAHAVARFWLILQDFVDSHPRPPWPLSSTHPILAVEAGVFLLRSPAVDAGPPTTLRAPPPLLLPAPSSSHTPPLPPIAMVSSLLLLSTAIPSTPSPTPVLGQPRLLLGCLHCHHLRLSVVAGCITSHGLLA
jgi:hypothetical protein